MDLQSFQYRPERSLSDLLGVYTNIRLANNTSVNSLAEFPNLEWNLITDAATQNKMSDWPTGAPRDHEVIVIKAISGSYGIQMMFVSTGIIYIRRFGNQWNDWKQISLS